MVSDRPPGRLARPVVSIVFTEPPPPEPSISRMIGMRNSVAICSDIFGLPLIEASADPPRRVKSSPAITTGAAVDGAAAEHAVGRHEGGDRGCSSS